MADAERHVGDTNIRFDPYNLAEKVKSQHELDEPPVRRRRGLHLPLAGKGSVVTARSFYKQQNERIQNYLKPVEDHVQESKQESVDNDTRRKIAVYGSFVCNIILSGLQLYGAVASGSLSLFTTMADSIFDPMSNLILIICNRASRSVNLRRFPAGKARIETVGNICFAFIMMAVSILLVAFPCQELVEGGESSFHLPAVIVVSIAFGTKFGLFLYCWSLRNSYSQVRILWEDHRNDLFINGLGILTSVGGSKLRWWIDPMGAILLSLLIAGLWLHTSTGEFKRLIGETASPEYLGLITYVSVTHSPVFTAIDTVRAYYSGPRIVIEVDVVMDPNENLRTCHDLAESLQTKLESLPDVERACKWKF